MSTGRWFSMGNGLCTILRSLSILFRQSSEEQGMRPVAHCRAAPGSKGFNAAVNTSLCALVKGLNLYLIIRDRRQLLVIQSACKR